MPSLAHGEGAFEWPTHLGNHEGKELGFHYSRLRQDTRTAGVRDLGDIIKRVLKKARWYFRTQTEVEFDPCSD